MKLLTIDSSRIVYLMQVHRPSGQLYLPDAVARIAQRYSFVKSPGMDQTTVFPLTFSVGKFNETQITELAIYNDGFIVSSASDTDLLDAFLGDFVPWAMKEFGYVELGTAKPEKFYESGIIVQSTADLSATVKPETEFGGALVDAMKSAKIDGSMQLSGFILDFDPKEFLSKRKPFRFILDRRVGVSFSENIFYSQSPFRTQDHLRVLASLEQIAGGTQQPKAGTAH